MRTPRQNVTHCLEDSDIEEDPRILAIGKEYQAEWESRGRPDRNRYLQLYPDLAGELNDLLDGLDLLHQGARALSGVGRPPRHIDPGLNRGDRLGEFEIIQEVGRGGMGIVYEAVQTTLNRHVAVKVLPSTFAADRTRLQRFIVEAQAAAAVVHPNIAPVYAIGEDRGIPYYAMRLVDGCSLDRLACRIASLYSGEKLQEDTRPDVTITRRSSTAPLAEKTTPPALSETMTEELVELARTNRPAYHRALACLGAQLARALDHAHRCGVVHRDIKPANLMLDRDGQAWITDFGLAQFREGPSVTRTGTAIGTLRYMSPEQAAGDRRRLDHRTDVYSLAVTLYELLAGCPAFPSLSPPVLLQQIASDEPRRLRSIDRTIAVSLETVLLKAMQKEPGDRYTTAAEFADDLERFMEGKQVVARQPRIWDHARKWTARHPGMLAVTMASLILVIVASGGAMALVSAERRETQLAYQQTQEAYQNRTQAYFHAEAMAESNRKRAEEIERRFVRAKELGDLVFKISEEEIGSSSAFQGPRRKLLVAALEIYRDLISTGQDQKVVAEVESHMKRVQNLLTQLDLKREGEAAFLLFHADVKAELAISTKQSEAIDRFTERQGGGGRGGFPGKGMGRPQLTPSLSQDAKIELIKSLTPTQRQRLRQIYVQFRGPSAFNELDVVEELALTPAQRQQIKSVQNEGINGFAMSAINYLGKIGGMPPKLPGGADPSVKLLDRILELLTPAQREAWKTLMGAPFRTRR